MRCRLQDPLAQSSPLAVQQGLPAHHQGGNGHLDGRRRLLPLSGGARSARNTLPGCARHRGLEELGDQPDRRRRPRGRGARGSGPRRLPLAGRASALSGADQRAQSGQTHRVVRPLAGRRGGGAGHLSATLTSVQRRGASAMLHVRCPALRRPHLRRALPGRRVGQRLFAHAQPARPGPAAPDAQRLAAREPRECTALCGGFGRRADEPRVGTPGSGCSAAVPPPPRDCLAAGRARLPPAGAPLSLLWQCHLRRGRLRG
mmetsp:Transcript_37409/g.93963  ORF Transcript_37409/g.93963 Transcript_37409/m.93963 type:complete len:259 (+) Transcript_37409:332-1108(+)